MALEERQEIGHIGIAPNGNIEVRHDTVVLKDGKEIFRSYHRKVLERGAPLAQEDRRVATVAQAVWAD